MAKDSGKAPQVVRFINSVVLFDKVLGRKMQVVEVRAEDYDITVNAYFVTITSTERDVDMQVPTSNVRSIDYSTSRV